MTLLRGESGAFFSLRGGDPGTELGKRVAAGKDFGGTHAGKTQYLTGGGAGLLDPHCHFQNAVSARALCTGLSPPASAEKVILFYVPCIPPRGYF